MLIKRENSNNKFDSKSDNSSSYYVSAHSSQPIFICSQCKMKFKLEHKEKYKLPNNKGSLNVNPFSLKMGRGTGGTGAGGGNTPLDQQALQNCGFGLSANNIKRVHSGP